MASDNGSSSGTDPFDRLLGNMHGLPDVIHSAATPVRAITPLTGATEMYIVQTYRQKDAGDFIFLEAVTRAGTVRLALPPAVADAIARQRDALTSKNRSRASRAAAEARIKRGELPGFMKGKRKR